MIKVEHAYKKFGEQTVLQNVSMEFGSGKIYGIVGRNGSGKTVLFKCILGFVSLDEGSVTIDGEVIGKDIDMARNVGIIIETPGFLPNFNAYKNLKFLASLKNNIGKEEIKACIKKVGLDPDSKKHVGKYSMGMRQRLAIAQAIMENPPILILDEPMNGLDKQGVEDVRELLIELREQGKTILIASHNAEDIDVLCDTVWEMDKGIAKIRN